MTTPYESDESGNLVNRLLQEQFRTRRETKTPKFKYFKVQAFGNSLHLKVTEVKPQIYFGAMVQTVDDNGSSTYKEIPRGVYYTGHVMSEPGSLVAINGNKGLVSEKLSGVGVLIGNAMLAKGMILSVLVALSLSRASQMPFRHTFIANFCPKGTASFAKLAIGFQGNNIVS